MNIKNKLTVVVLLIAGLLYPGAAVQANGPECRIEWEIICDLGPFFCIERQVLRCDIDAPKLPPCYPNCN
jgi:hypothetical protein